MRIRAVIVTLLALAACDDDTDPGPPGTGGSGGAMPTCETVFAEDFTDGLGQLDPLPAEGATLANVDGYLRASITLPTSDDVTATAERAVSFEPDPTTLRFFQTVRVGAWPADLEALIGCALVTQSQLVGLTLSEETRARLVVESGGTETAAVEAGDPLGPDERHVVALVVDRDESATSVRFLFDGVERGFVDAELVAEGEVTVRCGLHRASAGAGSGGAGGTGEAFAEVDDITLDICR